MDCSRATRCAVGRADRTVPGLTAPIGGTRHGQEEEQGQAVARVFRVKRGRLNMISHLFSQVPYKPFAPRDITLPKRQRPGGYVEPDLPLRHIPAPF